MFLATNIQTTMSNTVQLAIIKKNDRGYDIIYRTKKFVIIDPESSEAMSIVDKAAKELADLGSEKK